MGNWLEDTDFADLDDSDNDHVAKKTKEDPKIEFSICGEKKISAEYYGMALSRIHKLIKCIEIKLRLMSILLYIS